MNYIKINPYDIANGPGIRVSLWVSGCTHFCYNCFNQETWSFNEGQPFTYDTLFDIIELVSKPYIVGLSILGGDPLCQDFDGIIDLIALTKIVRKRLHKTVWLWTGYNFEDIKDIQVDLLKQCDVVVDGEYISSLRNITLPYCGSTNQRVIDIPKTLANNKIILYKEDNK